MINPKNLEYVHDDGETVYLTDGVNYYGLNYHNIDKSELREYANIEPTEVEKDEELLRTTDEKIIIGDTNRLVKDTHWEQRYNIEQTIDDMFDYWRRKII